jgi:hypothetical protein
VGACNSYFNWLTSTNFQCTLCHGANEFWIVEQWLPLTCTFHEDPLHPVPGSNYCDGRQLLLLNLLWHAETRGNLWMSNIICAELGEGASNSTVRLSRQWRTSVMGVSEQGRRQFWVLIIAYRVYPLLSPWRGRIEICYSNSWIHAAIGVTQTRSEIDRVGCPLRGFGVLWDLQRMTMATDNAEEGEWFPADYLTSLKTGRTSLSEGCLKELEDEHWR